MTRKALSLGFFAMLGLLVLLFPSSAQAAAAANSCSASGIFGGCSVTCPAGETPECSTGFLGTSASCTCSGSAGSVSTSTTTLQVSRAQEIAFDGYLQILSTMTSPQSRNVLNAAVQMTNAARANDVPAYFAAAAWHDQSLRNLPSYELAEISDYVEGPQH